MTGISQSHREYFIRRIAQEEAAVRNAADPRARLCHVQMAQTYRAALEVGDPETQAIPLAPSRAAGS